MDIDWKIDAVRQHDDRPGLHADNDNGDSFISQSNRDPPRVQHRPKTSARTEQVSQLWGRGDSFTLLYKCTDELICRKDL